MRIPAVPTAAIDSTPACFASAAIPAIASTVRAIGSAPRRPVSSSPSPRRVTSARSATVSHVPSASSSPTWNLTEFVPTSSTAKRRAPKRMSALSPRAMHVFRRPPSPSSRTAAITRPASSPSTTRVRTERPSSTSSESSVMHPPTVWCSRCLWTLDRPELAVRPDDLADELRRGCRRPGRATLPRRRSSATTAATSAAGSGNSPLITGRHCSSPSPSTDSRCLTSMRPPRIFTEASLLVESR